MAAEPAPEPGPSSSTPPSRAVEDREGPRKSASVQQLEEALEESDELWQLELRDPDARRRLMHREFVRSLLGLWIVGAALAVIGATLEILLVRGRSRYVPVSSPMYPWAVAANYALLAGAILVVLWTLIRYRDYRLAMNAIGSAPDRSW